MQLPRSSCATPRDTSPEVRTIAGFLAGYSGRTRECVHTLDLRMFYRWCEEHQLALFETTRTHMSSTARTRGAWSSRRHHWATPLILAGVYLYAAEEGFIAPRRLPMSADPALTTSPTPPWA
jgi:hypothetical protein